MKRENMTPWQRFMGLIHLDRRDVRHIIFYAIFAGLVALTVPLGIQAIINLIQGAQMSSSWVVLVVLVTLAVAFQGLLQWMQVRILEDVQQKIFVRSSFEFAYRFPKIQMNALRQYYPPELANRFFDTLTVQKGLSKVLLDLPSAILQIVFGLFLLSLYHPVFILYGAFLLLLIYWAFHWTGQRGLETSLEESKAKYKVAHWLQEIARSLVSFKLSGRTGLAMERNDRLTGDYLAAREKHFSILKLQYFSLIGFKVLITAGLLIIGGLLVLNQQMNIGQFVAAEIIILLVIASLEKLIGGLETFYDVLTSLEKIGQVVDKELELQDGTDPMQLNDELFIEASKMGYTNPEGRELIHDIDLTIEPGARIMLKGPSGSGKTVLLKLLAGLMPHTEGELFVNQRSTKGISPNAYRSVVGKVLPEQTPFEGTILENITLNDPKITPARVDQVLDAVGLYDFVKKQPKGLDTVLYPEGQQMARTIAKRIVLARAIVNEPKLLLLKDPLEYFEADEAEKIISYLCDPSQPWSLMVSSRDPKWEAHSKRILQLDDETIKDVTNA